MRRTILAVIMLLFGSASALAAGFQIPEMSTRAMGMANSFVALADDASANWYNPAGLAFQSGNQIMVGGLAVFPHTTFTSTAGTSYSAKNDTVFVPHFYYAGSSESLGVSYGLGVNAPYGLTVEWPATAPFATSAQKGKIEALNFNPNIAVELGNGLAASVGVQYVLMSKAVFDGTALRQNFNGDGWGYNLGLLYKSEGFSVGLQFRSQVKINASGTSTSYNPITGAQIATASNTITVKMPDTFSVGLAFHPAEDWTVTATAEWTNWKTFDQLAFTYSPNLIVLTPAPKPVPGLTVKEKWKATTAFRVGAEWNYASNMRARFGYTYDPTPISDPYFTPLIPGNPRQAVFLGYGYDAGNAVTLDLAYGYVWLKNRNQTASTGTNATRNGTYKTYIHLVSADVSWHF